MQQKEVHELIDRYLLGRISSPDLERLDQLRKSNPDIEQEIKESRDVMKVLKYLRYKDLRQKLIEIDKSDTDLNSFRFRDLLLGITLSILVLVSFLLWSANFYNPESVALRYFHHFPDASIITMEGKDISGDLSLAIKAFNERKYLLALTKFQSQAQDHDPDISIFASWNILLAHLAFYGPDQEWKNELWHFSATSYAPYGIESKRLYEMINSPLYDYINLHLSPQLSYMKPRLM
ncbi:MAG: hypothetical protein ABJC12_01640 [Saprospiraceae bacterium]